MFDAGETEAVEVVTLPALALQVYDAAPLPVRIVGCPAQTTVGVAVTVTVGAAKTVTTTGMRYTPGQVPT